MKSTGLLLADDLIFISRIQGTARSLGLDLQSVRNSTDLLSRAGVNPPSCVLLDLQNPGLDIGLIVQKLKTFGDSFIVGYGSHVDTSTLKAAREAGCDLVLPRSKFVEDLPTNMVRWFSGMSSES